MPKIPLVDVQAQYAPSMYVGLWSRTAGFRRDDLTRALEDRSVVQGTLLRAAPPSRLTEDFMTDLEAKLAAVENDYKPTCGSSSHKAPDVVYRLDLGGEAEVTRERARKVG